MVRRPVELGPGIVEKDSPSSDQGPRPPCPHCPLPPPAGSESGRSLQPGGHQEPPRGAHGPSAGLHSGKGGRASSPSMINTMKVPPKPPESPWARLGRRAGRVAPRQAREPPGSSSWDPPAAPSSQPPGLSKLLQRLRGQRHGPGSHSHLGASLPAPPIPQGSHPARQILGGWAKAASAERTSESRTIGTRKKTQGQAETSSGAGRPSSSPGTAGARARPRSPRARVPGRQPAGCLGAPRPGGPLVGGTQHYPAALCPHPLPLLGAGTTGRGGSWAGSPPGLKEFGPSR